MRYRHIVWDWNGTLLDDGRASAHAVELMILKRSLGSFSLDDYRDRITFPVIQLYYDSGFDFSAESYEDMCVEFIRNYKANSHMITLQDNVREALSFFKGKGIKQHIVSASEAGILVRQIEEYGLTGFFDTISGQQDHRADSKTHLAERLIGSIGCDPSEILFIGDTIHDFEISKELEACCFLVANGHCSTERLAATKAPVFSDLGAILKSFDESVRS